MTYWDTHLHDQAMSKATIGSAEFFADLARYRYNKLAYLPQRLDFAAYAGQRVLEVGCGIGLDLMRFAQAGAQVTGIDLSARGLQLAADYAQQQNVTFRLQQADAQQLPFANAYFDFVYCHGTLPYVADPAAVVNEMRRVLRPSGTLFAMTYGRNSWLYAMSKLTGTGLEHQDAPHFHVVTMHDLESWFSNFGAIATRPERYPVATELHAGLKAQLFNNLFVGGFNALPRWLTRPLGWHLLIYAQKDEQKNGQPRRLPMAQSWHD